MKEFIPRVSFSRKRKEAMELLFRELSLSFCPLILEVGRTRDKRGIESDGYSTIHFSQFCAEEQASLISVDSNPGTEVVCREILEGFSIPLVGVDFWNYPIEKVLVDGFQKKVNLLFLDGLDYYPGMREESENSHLEIIKRFEGILEKGALVAVDDCSENNSYGKGKKAIVYMEERGYKVLIRGYMWVLQKP